MTGSRPYPSDREKWARRLANLSGLAGRARPPVGQTPHDCVFEENKWRLLRYRSAVAPRWRRPVLLVPSLINRHYVMDLLPGKSLAAYLVAEGHDVFVVDWGTPGDEDRFLGFDDVAGRYLDRALRRTARIAGADRAHVLGYCLGGTLAVVHAAVQQGRIASLALLAAPVRFEDDGPLSAWTRSATFRPDAVVRAFGNVPWQLLQGAFHMIRPTLGLSKSVALLDRAWNDEFLDGFLALETWGHDNVSFPGACFEKYIVELYKRDALVKGELRLLGRPARLSAITCPVYVVTFAHDGIVPHESARVLLDHVTSLDKHHLHLAGGHVGAVVSRAASKGLWPALATFFRDRDR